MNTEELLKNLILIEAGKNSIISSRGTSGGQYKLNMAQKRAQKKKEAERIQIELNNIIMIQLGKPGMEVLDQVYAAFGISDVASLKNQILPNAAKDFDEFYSHENYQKLLPLCELAKMLGGKGDAIMQALKLSVLFPKFEQSIQYLSRFKKANSGTCNNQIVHDACSFTLPKIKGVDNISICQFAQWQNLAEKNMQHKRFRDLLPHAASIEKYFMSDKPPKINKKTLDNIKQLGNDLETTNRKLKRLQKKDAVTQTEQEKIELRNLSESVSEKKIELANACREVGFKNLNLLALESLYEKHKNSSMLSHNLLVKAGIKENKINQFNNLIRKDSDSEIPDIVINGVDINHPGYYLRKLHVEQDEDAALGAILGLKTNCCQSLTGSMGEPCTIYGLTSEYSGFYVLFEGDVHNQSLSDNIIGQSWIWRSRNDALVFDSIETNKSVENAKEITKDFYTNLSKILVDSKHTHKVSCGSSLNGFVIGEACLFEGAEVFKDYYGYHDSKFQYIIVDKQNPLLSYDNNEECKKEVDMMIISACQDHNTPLMNNLNICKVINYYSRNKNSVLKDTLETFANQSSRIKEVEYIQEQINNFSNNEEKHCKDYLYLIDNSKLPLVLLSPQGTLLHMAVKEKNTDLCLQLIKSGINVDIKNYDNKTALMTALDSQNYELVLKLVQNGADANSIIIKSATKMRKKQFLELIEEDVNVNIRDNETHESLLHLVVSRKIFSDVVSKLIEKGGDINAINAEGDSVLSKAIEYGSKKTCLMLIDKGANVNTCNDNGDTPLSLAIERAIESECFEICIKLIEAGADYSALRGALIELQKTEINDAISLIETSKKQASDSLSLDGKPLLDSHASEMNKTEERVETSANLERLPSGKKIR